MLENWRFRAFLGLTQQEVSFATGINVTRISLEERGLATYHPSEQALVTSFFERQFLACGYKPERPSFKGILAEVTHA